MRTAKRLALVAAIVLILALLASVVLPFFGLVEANCSYTDVDLATGRLRTTRYVLWCPISRDVEDSEVTKVLPADYLANAKPQWRPALFDQPIRTVFIDSIYGRAVVQLRMLPYIWRQCDFPQAARQRTALHLLAIWQATDSPDPAEPYVRSLDALVDNPERQQVLKTLTALDMPKIEPQGSSLLCTYFLPDGKPLFTVHAHRDTAGRLVTLGDYVATTQP